MQDPKDNIPKGMVRTETGRLVTKAKAEADLKAFSDAMQDQYMNRAKDAAKARAMKLGSMMKKKELPNSVPKNFTKGKSISGLNSKIYDKK
jgi:hypothetical protein